MILPSSEQWPLQSGQSSEERRAPVLLASDSNNADRTIFIAAGGASPGQLSASVGVVTADPDLRIFSVLSQSRVISHSALRATNTWR